LSGELNAVGLTADTIQTTATVTIIKQDKGFAITAVHLDVKAKIPGASPDAFNAAAKNAREGCPVSKVLRADITMNAVLES